VTAQILLPEVANEQIHQKYLAVGSRIEELASLMAGMQARIM